MKKQLSDILNKAYYKPLNKMKFYRANKNIITQYLNRRNIPTHKAQDLDVLANEIVYECIKIKEQVEEIFFDAYVQMYDYWNDITYLQRKAQMQLVIHEYVDTLPSFYIDDKKIFMPCFNEAINHLYYTETVLLDLKQYKPIIRTYVKEIDALQFGKCAFSLGLGSARLICDDENAYVLYLKDANRFYLCCDNKCLEYYSFSIKKIVFDEEDIEKIGRLILNKDQFEIIDLLVEKAYVGEKIKKKLLKWKAKIIKQNLKSEGKK